MVPSVEPRQARNCLLYVDHAMAVDDLTMQDARGLLINFDYLNTSMHK